MKVIFEKEKLLSVLIPAATIAPNKNTNYILECVLFECPSDREGKCRISAYDMEKGLRTYVDCETVEEGSFAMNSQNVLQIVRSMPEGSITLEVDKRNRAKISGGSASFEIGAFPGESYPALPLLSGDKNYKLPQHVFRDLINKTIFAASQTEIGKAFSGIFFKAENNTLTCVGCDRFMIAAAEYESTEEMIENKFIVPAKVLSEIVRSVKDSEDEMVISVARKHVVISIGEYLYFSRLIDDEYVNYKRILAFPSDTDFFVNCKAFLSAVERASIVTEDRLGGKTKNSLVINYKNKVMEITSNSANGSVYDEIPAASEDIDEEMTFKYNCRYIMNVLKAASEDTSTVKISLSSSKLGMGTMGMKVTNGDSDPESSVDYTYYIMPINNLK